MNTQNNTVLITGGGSGIGLALARGLLARGNSVLVCGRNSDRLERAQRELPGLLAFACDITDEADRERLCAFIETHLPRLNVLVNNAGMANTMDLSTEALDAAALEQEVATNFNAPILLTARLLPLLRSQPRSAVINVTAVLAHAPIALLPVHSATKAALRSFTRSLRRQLAGSTVEVIDVVPPVVDTAMQRGLDVPKLDADLFAERVLRRLERGDQDIHVGQARAFRIGARVAPETLFRLLNATVERALQMPARTPEVSHARA